MWNMHLGQFQDFETFDIFWISGFSTNFSDVDLYMDRTIHISWYVDVAGGSRGVAGGRGGSRGVAGRGCEPISTWSVTLFFVFTYCLTLMSQCHV